MLFAGINAGRDTGTRALWWGGNAHDASIETIHTERISTGITLLQSITSLAAGAPRKHAGVGAARRCRTLSFAAVATVRVKTRSRRPRVLHVTLLTIGTAILGADRIAWAIGVWTSAIARRARTLCGDIPHCVTTSVDMRVSVCVSG